MRCDDPVGDLGEQDSDDDGEFVEADEAAAGAGGRDLRDVHGAKAGGETDGETSADAPCDKGVEGAGHAGADAGDGEDESRGDEGGLASEALAEQAGEHGADQAADERAAHGPALDFGRDEVEVGFVEGLCAADDDPVVTEEKSAKGGDGCDPPDVKAADLVWRGYGHVSLYLAGRGSEGNGPLMIRFVEPGRTPAPA